MAKVIFLGTASAVAFEGHENTYLVIQGDESSILVDCASNPIIRLKQAGVHFEDVSDLIITHFHADHVSGLPNLLMDMWILQRKKPFRIYGTEYSISRVKKMMALFDWDEWKGMYPVTFHTLPAEERTLVLENQEFRIHSSPGEHLIPTIGLRIEGIKDEFTVAYSCDTSPHPAIMRLASDADILIHESTGPYEGHSTPTQAGDIAVQANAGKLYLVHYSIYGDKTASSILEEAKKTFPGDVILAEDYMEINFIK
ncbi:MAG: MBL fold metallo-hydrolase [Anaerolineales bacterium]|nr:MBL fold metallo-hydrolase [Anaerolineales bacterium]